MRFLRSARNDKERMKILLSIKKSFLSILVYTFIFFASLTHPVDTDLGWHLKYGEYFFKYHSLLNDNIFSTEMPNYHYINSAWGTDILTYVAFQKFRFLGVSILGAAIVTLAFLCMDKASRLTTWERIFILPLSFYFLFPLTGNSFRGQLVSLLGISTLYWLINAYEQKPGKIILLTIPLFFLWVNLHGGWIVGLGLLTLWIIIYLFRLYLNSNKENLKKRNLLYFTLIGSAVATLINPYGIFIYQEILTHMKPPLQEVILEWTPTIFNSTYWWYLIGGGVLVGVNILLLFYQKKILRHLFYILVCLGFFIASFSIHRHMWTFFLISIPLFVPVFQAIKPKENYVKNSIYTGTFVIATVYVGITLYYRNLLHMNWNTYCDRNHCSKKSADFLVKHKPAGRLMSHYDWGGWLIWNYPQIKPNIDGRMAFWEDETGYNALAKHSLLTLNLRDIDKSKYDVIYMNYNSPIYERITQLVKEKRWKMLYQDQFAFIAARKK